MHARSNFKSFFFAFGVAGAFMFVCLVPLNSLQADSNVSEATKFDAEHDALKPLVESLVLEIQSDLRQGLVTPAKMNQTIDMMIESKLLPHINDDHLARRVFRQHWNDIEENQVEQLARSGVLQSLIRTYKIAFGAYDGEDLTVASVKHKKNFSTSRVVIGAKSGQTHMIDFAFRKFDGVWQVYDFSVDGVVMSKTLAQSVHHQIKKLGLIPALEQMQ